MYIHGEFVNKKGNIISVEILTNGSRSPEYLIDEDNDSEIHFTEDPVDVTCEINDTFDVLVTHSATIRLESRIALTDLYCRSCMDAKVNIRRDGVCIFAGYIEPQSYSQSFNDYTDEVEINCIDVLSAMQYSRYAGIDNSISYANRKRSAGTRTFLSLIQDAVGTIADGLDISGSERSSILYDASRKLTTGMNTQNIFSLLNISELLFLGDDEDSTWTRQDVVAEILRYLNLHIEQEGFSFYIYSWDTAKNSQTVSWAVLEGVTASSLWRTVSVKTLSKDNVADMNTTISVGEAFNLISLTCQIEDADVLVESPLSSDTISSPYAKRQKYLTVSTFKENKPTVKDWYIRLKNNQNWVFYCNNGGLKFDLYSNLCKDGSLVQENIPNYLGVRTPALAGDGTTGRVGAALIEWGNVERVADPDDNSPVSKIDMTDYMVVNVGGNGSDSQPYPNESVLQWYAPVAEYTGPSSGAVYSPSDSSTINYLVFTGTVFLSPIVDPGEEIYERTWWKTTYPCGPESVDTSRTDGLCPPDENDQKMYEFSYSAVGNSNDNISKVAVLACMLIIGDKCLVETGTQGQVSDFEWRTYKKRTQCASDDEYYEQSFTIGFDPKKGDKLLGTEFNIQNNINYDLGLDVEGMAVPITKADNLHGEVSFQILGPVNVYWDEVTKRHRTWFRSEKWKADSVPLMAHVENIYLKDFEVKVHSNNSLNENAEDADLIYISDTDEKYVNKKDDITFRIASALTTAERIELGVKDVLSLSTPMLGSGEGLLSIYDDIRKENGKPEQLYVDAAWREWHIPKVQMQQTIQDDGNSINRFDIFRHPALPEKNFFIQGISRNLMEGEATLNLKEIGND